MPLRRSFGKRRRRSKYRRRKSRFVRAVARAEVANSSKKKFTYAAQVGENLVQGDGTSRTLVIQTPVSNLVQGTGKVNFIEDTISNVYVRVRAIITTDTTNYQYGQLFIRWVVFWSPQRASYLTTGQVFGNTTRSNAGPTQTSPLANPNIFDITTNSNPFVGSSFATPFDTTNIRIIATKVISVNPGGAANGVRIVKFKLPIAKKVRYQDTQESPLTSTPNFPRNGNYYLMYQTFGPAGTANVANTILGQMDTYYTLYFSEL